MKLSRYFLILTFIFLTGCTTMQVDNLAEYQIWNIQKPAMLYEKSYIFFDKAPHGGMYMGCNRYNFHWEANETEKTLSFDNIMATRIACHKDYKEAEYIEMLMRTTRYELDNNKMYLYEDDDLLFKLQIHPKSKEFFKDKYGEQRMQSYGTAEQENIQSAPK